MQGNLKSLIAVFDLLNGKIGKLADQLNSFKTVKGEQGAKGKDGIKGSSGVAGKVGKRGEVGKLGKAGQKGSEGAKGVGISDVELDFDNILTVTLTDGSEIEAGEITLTGNGEKNSYHTTVGGNSSIQYTKITYSPYYIDSAKLVNGINMFGVSAGEDVTVYLPDSSEPTRIITINNENPNYAVVIKPLDSVVDELGNAVSDVFGNKLIG